MKRISGLFLAVVLLLGSTSLSYGAGYTDIKNSNWAYAAIDAMSNKQVISGYPDGSFKPNNTVTYGEFIKMALIAGTGADAGNSSTGHWAMNYYNKALELKYFTNDDIGKFQLGNPITRGDMALIVSAILGNVKIDKYDELQKGITDITYQTEHEYDITKAYATGVLTGYPDNTFKPEKTLTRAESAMVIYRLVDESKRVLPEGKKDQTTTGSSIKVYKTSGLLDMSKLTQDKIITKSANFTDSYELYTDASTWGIKLYRSYDGEDCSFDHTLKGFIYLVKDGAIIDYCQTTPMYDEDGNYIGFQRSTAECDITQADYIMSVPTEAAGDSQLIKIVINPFKK